MRLAALRGDPGFHLRAHEATVTCGGEPMAWWIIADEERGFVTCLETDERGELLPPDERDRFRIVVFHGPVSITVPYDLAVELTP